MLIWIPLIFLVLILPGLHFELYAAFLRCRIVRNLLRLVLFDAENVAYHVHIIIIFVQVLLIFSHPFLLGQFFLLSPLFNPFLIFGRDHDFEIVLFLNNDAWLFLWWLLPRFFRLLLRLGFGHFHGCVYLIAPTFLGEPFGLDLLFVGEISQLSVLLTLLGHLKQLWWDAHKLDLRLFCRPLAFSHGLFSLFEVFPHLFALFLPFVQLLLLQLLLCLCFLNLLLFLNFLLVGLLLGFPVHVLEDLIAFFIQIILPLLLNILDMRLVFILILFHLIQVFSLLFENLRQFLSLKKLVFTRDLHLVWF